MENAAISEKVGKKVPLVAQTGLFAKGFVYVLLGTIVLLNSLHISSSSSEADKVGVVHWVQESFGGRWLVPILGLGVCCYAAWRFIEVYRLLNQMQYKWQKALRYFFSGTVYFALGVSILKMVLHKPEKNGDSEQRFAAELLSKPFGEWMVGIAALIIACIGMYQVYYAISEKYKNHVQKMNLHDMSGKVLLTAGKIGYTARGIVWLIISWLMFRAAISGSSSEAGDTSKAFNFVETEWGTPILALIAAGLVAYGIFNFVRARYERFMAL